MNFFIIYWLLLFFVYPVYSYTNEDTTPVFKLFNWTEWVDNTYKKFQPSTLMHEYEKWFTRNLLDSNIPCNEKQVLLFTSDAGIGDSTQALIQAFKLSLQLGRMFMVSDIGHHSWKVTLTQPPFDWDYSDAIQHIYICGDTVTPVKSTFSNSEPAIVLLKGTITKSHWILTANEDPRRFPRPDYLSEHFVVNYFLQPNEKVMTMMRNTMKEMEKYKVIIGLQIRTGNTDFMRFLSPGDENRFIYCSKKILEKILDSHQTYLSDIVIYVTSDDIEITRYVVSKLNRITKTLFLDFPVSITTNYNPSDDPVGLYKVYSDFFLLSKANIAILTHSSCFGTASMTYGNPSLNIHRSKLVQKYFISNSQCNEKKRYPGCHKPKFPDICDDKNFDIDDLRIIKDSSDSSEL